MASRKVTPCFIWFQNFSWLQLYVYITKIPKERGQCQAGVFLKFPYKAAIYFGRSLWKLLSTGRGISIYSSGILDPLTDWCPGQLPSWAAQLAWCLRTLGGTLQFREDLGSAWKVWPWPYGPQWENCASAYYTNSVIHWRHWINFLGLL